MTVIAQHGRSSLAERVACILADRYPAATESPTVAEVIPTIYVELRRLAESLLRRERGNHTLQPTAVVNEVFLRLHDVKLDLSDRRHSLRLIAQSMRRILIDYGRARSRLRRCQPPTAELRELLTEHHDPYNSVTPLDFLDVADALQALERHSVRTAQIVELRYFFGLEEREMEQVLHISEATICRELRFARAWLTAYAKRTARGEHGCERAACG